MDTVTPEKRSWIMSRIRSKNTGPERLLNAAMLALGLRFTRWAELPGKPDFYMAKYGLAIDVRGCFWHGCPKHGSRPKSNKSFWDKKIINNKKRDKRNARKLHNMGFILLRFWECEINADAARCAREVKNVRDEQRAFRQGTMQGVSGVGVAGVGGRSISVPWMSRLGFRPM